MNKTQKLAQAIIEKIHGMPWSEARWVDAIGTTKANLIDDAQHFDEKAHLGYGWLTGWTTPDGEDLTFYKNDIWALGERKIFKYRPYIKPITFSRVIEALIADNVYSGVDVGCQIVLLEFGNAKEDVLIPWKILNEDKSTATLEDQSEETIEALSEIFLSRE